MEEKGIEWVCPNCLRKKAEEEKAKSGSQSVPGKPRTPKSDTTNENSVLATKETPSSSTTAEDGSGVVPVSGTMQCVVCKKEARNSSIYCSDACILAHAQETLTKDKPATPTGSKPSKSPITDIAKAKAEARVIVFDRKTGKVLTGKWWDGPQSHRICNPNTSKRIVLHCQFGFSRGNLDLSNLVPVIRLCIRN